MSIQIRRREFMFTLGGTAAWPLAVRAQHTVDPVIGFLSSVDPASLEWLLAPAAPEKKRQG
ncbi:MAG: hypothetical protein QOK03_557, partial [Candidatus Binataceae bacterium]|nr:hypothetical protein [Candidatus Binataceae bacterium]